MFFWEFSNLILSWIHSHIAFIVIVDAGTGHTMGWSLIGKKSFFCGPSLWINCDRKQVSIRNGSMALILIELRAHKMGWCSISQKKRCMATIFCKNSYLLFSRASKLQQGGKERESTNRVDVWGTFLPTSCLPFATFNSLFSNKKLSPQTKEQKLRREFMSEGPSFHLAVYPLSPSVHLLYIRKCNVPYTALSPRPQTKEQRLRTELMSKCHHFRSCTGCEQGTKDANEVYIPDIPSVIWLSLTKKEQGARDYKKGWSWSPPALGGRKETGAKNNFTL